MKAVLAVVFKTGFFLSSLIVGNGGGGGGLCIYSKGVLSVNHRILGLEQRCILNGCLGS